MPKGSVPCEQRGLKPGGDLGVSCWTGCVLLLLGKMSLNPRLRASSTKCRQGRRENERAHLHKPWFVLVGARRGGGMVLGTCGRKCL